ncbi:hypothetical protein BX616_003045 [Lobosporangium transversale]|uniref:Wax synthase domain-containing protein n=1 Tax=Lobosporangium transversale TaxID=64571 RepID=A0A1Y2GJ85_9FUNG|nr:hypothetical protein BCR41DRAFT_356185 [Lobosporangium transversale]KAF9899426.1 hypothetical protein BX616_003045 [Lobosporangium transversale]ORZ12502.1 hypothetical protein BCR41DRAFT_356185 [Lobosporangium transversale]|eukprot:XP_021880121.1 hypothetical protein BCR41DRAFT_356185 [Lobosporangium transversale]
MEIITASMTQLKSTLNKLIPFSSFVSSLPPSLPVAPPLLGQNSLQIPLPDCYYFSIFLIFGCSLYFLLLLPLPRLQKQCIAAPLLLGLFTAPIFFTTLHSPGSQLLHDTACACVLMRMVDLYYVRPWRTGKEPTLNFDDWWVEVWQPFRKVPLNKEQLQRHELELQQTHLRGELDKISKSTKDTASGFDRSNQGLPSPSTINNNGSSNGSNSVSLSSDISKTELNKGKIVKHVYIPPTDPNPQHWSAYLPRVLLYVTVLDCILFYCSFLTYEDIQGFSLTGRMLFDSFLAVGVLFGITLAWYIIMILWAVTTGNLIHDTEWTLVRHQFPGFATSPAEFWRRWHHIFKRIWVDLGFKPVHHLLQKYLTPRISSMNKSLAMQLERALPVMAVFLMSGLMHEMFFFSLYHISPGSMTVFFLIQGAGTIVSDMLSNTVGRKVSVPPVILIGLTLAFNLSTASLFSEPAIKVNGHNTFAKQSLLVHGYNYLRSNGVF